MLRFAPRGYRRWGPGVVATAGLDGIAYLADFSIGANIGMQHGTTNVILGIAGAAVIIAGPGWVFFGATKQLIGLFLAVYIVANVAGGAGIANEPVHQFLSAYEQMMPHGAAMALAVVLVVISQIKINVT